MAKARTKLPNGKKPSYKQLEESFLDLWDKTQILIKDQERLNQELADARYTIGKLKGN